MREREREREAKVEKWRFNQLQNGWLEKWGKRGDDKDKKETERRNTSARKRQKREWQ